LVKLEKTLQTNIATCMVCMTLDCVGITQSSVIRIIHRSVGLRRFFHLPKFLLLSLVFAYIYILQGSVETHLPCGGIYSNHIIANCLQCAPVKEFCKSVNNWRRYGQKYSGTFFMVHDVIVAFTRWQCRISLKFEKFGLFCHYHIHPLMNVCYCTSVYLYTVVTLVSI